MTYTLHTYQEAALDFVIDRLYTRDLSGAGLLMDIGTGKSAVTLTAIQQLIELGALRRVLICAPLRVIDNTYPDEIEKWAPKLSHVNLHDRPALIERLKLNLPVPEKVFLINPDSLFKLVEIAHLFDLVVIDESSGFKTWTSKGPRGRMRSLRHMLPSIPKRMILTGTPTPESLAELHPQIFILDNGEALGKNATVFRARFCSQGGWKGRKWVLRSGVEDELMNLVAPMVFRVDAADHLEMPALIENNVWVNLPPEAENQYKILKRELALALEDGGEILIGHAAALYNKLKQVSSGRVYLTSETGEKTTSQLHKEKLQALSELQSELYGKPALIFYQYTCELEDILGVLNGKVGVINGRTNSKDSSKALKDWNAGKLRWLAAHPKCLSHGINAQHGGCDMIWYGLTDSCETYLQARGRLHRQGQKSNQVRVHRILTRGTVEELQLERLGGKISGQTEFLEKLKRHAKS